MSSEWEGHVDSVLVGEAVWEEGAILKERDVLPGRPFYRLFFTQRGFSTRPLPYLLPLSHMACSVDVRKWGAWCLGAAPPLVEFESLLICVRRHEWRPDFGSGWFPDLPTYLF